MESKIADFIKERRKQLELTQPELAERAGVGLRFIRELEQGKQTVRLDKVNQVLHFFGSQLGVVEMEIVWEKQTSITKMNSQVYSMKPRKASRFNTMKTT